MWTSTFTSVQYFVFWTIGQWGVDNTQSMKRSTEFSLVCFLKLRYYGNCNHITQIAHSKTNLKPLKVIVSDLTESDKHGEPRNQVPEEGLRK